MRRSSLKSVQAQSQDPRLRIMKQFGGTLLKKSHAKVARPISTKHAMHVVMRSSQARGEWSFRAQKHRKQVEGILRSQGIRYGVRILEFANGGDHFQMVLKITDRISFHSFLRAISGMIAMKVSDAAKTRALKNKFWDCRPWTRVVERIAGFSLADDSIVHRHLQDLKLLIDLPRDYHRYFKEAPA